MLMLSKLFVLIVFITNCDKMATLSLFGCFLKKLLQSKAKRENLTNFKLIITKSSMMDCFFEIVTEF